MKASIIIANYNNSKYIDECIESLYNQTYKDLEIIFFDDNSYDNSIDVIKNYKKVKIIENKNQTKFGSFNQMNAFIKGIRY
ncbi:glycosyltransferase, partial [Candidatus Pelagibacter sp.]|nr:glycosyltransferase [Candidatus Pelagibacter sp.]